MVVILVLLCLFQINSIKAEEVKTDKVLKEKKPVFYHLVHENLKPDHDEFYVSSVYKIQDTPRALIKRSTNGRASDLYTHFHEYGIGDAISDHFRIIDIDSQTKEIIVKKIDEDKYYGLNVSYSKAKSRLTLKPNYVEKNSTKLETKKPNDTKPEKDKSPS